MQKFKKPSVGMGGMSWWNVMIFFGVSNFNAVLGSYL